MIVMKLYRDIDGDLTFDKQGESVFTVRSKTMSGIYNMTEMLAQIENRENTNLEDYV